MPDEPEIPPAWREVWICVDPKGHLQATGRDARGQPLDRLRRHLGHDAPNQRAQFHPAADAVVA